MPDLRPFARLFLAALALTLAARPSAAEDAGAHGPLVVVLDGSGSMWGNIPGERPAKFDLARQALRQSLSSLSPQVRLGLMSFGQRRRADCSDVEVLAPPEAGPPERILSIADKLNPKGKGPLSLALREAAKQIPADTAGSIIAIHDGMDNCAQDPCAVAADIATTNPKTRIFLIGFALDKTDARHLVCVGAATKGKVIQAQDSTQLADAISEALTLADLARVDPETGVAVPAPQAATPPQPAGAPGLSLTAALAAEGKPLAAAIGWTVAKAEAPDVVVAHAHARELAVDLAPGSYVVEAKLGQASVRQTLEVKAEGPTVAKLSLGAGVLNLKAQADKEGTALAHPLVTIFAKDGADGATQRPVWIGREAATQLVLPAGTYLVRVEDGLAQQTTETRLAEGAGVDVHPVLGTGQLALSAVSAANGAPLKEVTYTIEEDDPDSPQGRREVARTADPAATFTLPAGTYYVAARSGAAEVHERIALGSGATIRHVATLNLVSITVNVTVAAPEGTADSASAPVSPSALPIVIRILSEAGQSGEIGRAHGATSTFQLPPARYRVEAEVMGLNVKAAGIIDLTTGRGGSVALKLEQGEVSINAGAASGRHWRIKDSDGRTVMHAGRSDAGTARLAPGRYVLLTDVGDKRIEQAFDLKSGERRQLTPGAP
ncbi:VWA domain-containing protein [Hyphomicrobium sp.]|uniref:VWA domain-containing protein n=1 Tax=Hyphomicrobium sp. TaxID=82 RepID=UPI0025BF1510|nr:VWA domain-containing protein [Hyphomicrobium sp.]MCC7251351.1 VWA domain-containing protein [Hyphomicrobium sp.]